MSLKMNSQAQTTVMKAIMGLVLAFFMLLIITAVGYGLYSLFFASDLDKGTYESFEALGATVEALLKRPASEEAGYSILPLYIQSDAGIIVFFDSVCSYSQKDKKCPVSVCHSSDSNYHIPKPPTCVENKPCICLFKETAFGRDFDGEDNMPKKCISFETDFEEVAFVSYYEDSSEFKDTKNLIDGARMHNSAYEWPVIYGECGEAWSVTDLYIWFEKVEVIGSKYLFEIVPNYPDEYGKTFSEKNEEAVMQKVKCGEGKKYGAGKCIPA